MTCSICCENFSFTGQRTRSSFSRNSYPDRTKMVGYTVHSRGISRDTSPCRCVNCDTLQWLKWLCMDRLLLVNTVWLAYAQLCCALSRVEPLSPFLPASHLVQAGCPEVEGSPCSTQRGVGGRPESRSGFGSKFIMGGQIYSSGLVTSL